MKNLLLPLALVAAAACSRPEKDPDSVRMASSATSPKTGVLDAVYEILDKESRERVGLVKKRRYGDRIIYWVYDTKGDRRGYVLSNNRAYVYDWHVGQRTEEARFVGADTIAAGSRRVVGYGRPVVLEKTSLETLAKEVLEKQEAPPSGDE